jgi:GTP-binding protein HflX
VLGEIGAGHIPELLVFNKADVAPTVAEDLARRYPGSVVISARRGQGVDALVEAIAHQLHLASRTVDLRVPFSRGDVLAALHREGEVLEASEGDGWTLVRAKLPASALAQFASFLVDDPDEPASEGLDDGD